MKMNNLEDLVTYLIIRHLGDEVFMEKPWMFEVFPDKFKTREICDRVVEIDPNFFDFVPQQFKTQAMCKSVFHGIQIVS